MMLLLLGIFMALIITLIPNTYSWYTKSEGVSGDIKAASVKEILDLLEIKNKNNEPIVRIRKNADLDYSPVIFFSLEGEAREYVLHIDPIQLFDSDTYEIPIIPNVNLPQAISLILSGKDRVEGKLYIKHLNQFINEEHSISISKDHLLKTYFLGKGIENTNYSSIKDKEITKLLVETLDYVGEFLEWEEIYWEEDNTYKSTGSKYTMPISKANIRPYQIEIIEKLAPNLIKYNNILYSELEDMTDKLNIKIDHINSLTMEKESLMEKNKDLDFKNQILEKERASLIQQINLLEVDIMELHKKDNEKSHLSQEELELIEEGITIEDENIFSSKD